MGTIRKILIVCTGNSCRSPMAEGFLKKYLKPEDGFEIMSAGISAVEGLNPTPEAAGAMKEDGIDISSIFSRPLSALFIKAADLILVMSQAHRQFILERLPEAKDKVYLFKEFARTDDTGKEVADPMGQPLLFYKSVKEEIKRASIEIARRVKENNSD